ncbi:MAG TPA: cell division protein FtsQ/DivIB [Amaricoccus sp.]|uniref:cell division protein FtsQ/DivIB n=1 Tax=Amaricoccus sp. TaxID=1872485 RepID=UPI002BA33AA2|nr:cell division protein FtsQ/DivIB [Amaricoccus sp.]HMQ91714.1 cell division protein FtsQ/DivIB [Amaricoccus sp.]HMR52574.1 cell division protein FtsQ/DivIB [Amaricoccus sp.]HMR59267.1 cell division protein FtsQ/DivIB [Amaricoccus sp.]HMT99556.1 cell division protein FtsQ/DivIB [Amaricoccus sp.]
MLPVKTPRRDPAPSRLRYRLTRLWLRPGFRRLANFGLPMLAGLLAAWTLMAEYDLRGRAMLAFERMREAIVEQPQFVITRIDIPDVSPDLAEQIRVAAFVDLPASSLEVDVVSVRARIEALDAVERARVRAPASGVLEIRAIERVPVVVWRSGPGLQLLDPAGVRVAEVDSRLRRPDLPLIAGEGAAGQVPEALELFALARPLHDRIRGLVRMGERRWDLVLDRDQVIRLPETGAAAALAHVMDLQAAEDLMDRDLTVVDMRDPRRPILRLGENAVAELVRVRAMVAGEDA